MQHRPLEPTSVILIVLILLFALNHTKAAGHETKSVETRVQWDNQSQIFKEVQIKGQFSNYIDYKNWTVFVTKAPSPKETLNDVKRMEREAKKFPVSIKGTFQMIIKDVPFGDYYLNFGQKDPEGSCGGCGGLRITINRAVIDLGVIEGDI